MAHTVGLTFEVEKPRESKKDIVEKLEAAGIEFDPKLTLSELRKLLPGK